MEKLELNWFRGKRILLTGHTGFKGAWLSKILLESGSRLSGFALEPPTTPSLFKILNIENDMESIYGDVRDYNLLKSTFDRTRPELVIHMAAQPLVRESYANPVLTYETNVMGTVNVCECVRLTPGVTSFLNVTTDKVYENKEWEWGYRENEPLDGFDPYSNSKSCSELVTHSYINSFFKERGIAASTARAGNVIGGGDFSKDRIIPDCIRAIQKKKEIIVRNPGSTRPYQHVLEPLGAYLTILKKQYESPQIAGYYNVGPNESDCVTTADIASMFCAEWREGAKWVARPDYGPHEANFLKLDCSKIKNTLGWHPRWDIRKAIAETVQWTKLFISNNDMNSYMSRQIGNYFGDE